MPTTGAQVGPIFKGPLSASPSTNRPGYTLNGRDGLMSNASLQGASMRNSLLEAQCWHGFERFVQHTRSNAFMVGFAAGFRVWYSHLGIRSLANQV